MVDVLEARMQFRLHAFSKSAKICCLTGMFSTAASMTCRQGVLVGSLTRV